MTRRIVAPLMIGLIGAAILISLGIWQVQRLAWKEGVLAQIEDRIQGEPTQLKFMAAPQAARFLPVVFEGRSIGAELHVLVSHKKLGAGYRIVKAFEMEGGSKFLLDLGFIPVDQKNDARAELSGEVFATLHLPDDRNSSTPQNDVQGNIWFARDISEMSNLLGTMPLLAVLREASGLDPSVTPLPVDTSAIPNDHLEYAITWFSLAAIWLGMTGFWLWRIRQRTL